MIKEIMEQPDALRKCLFPRIRDRRVVLEDLSIGPDYIRLLNKIYIVACGSSYHVGMVSKYFLEKLLRTGGGGPGLRNSVQQPYCGR